MGAIDQFLVKSPISCQKMLTLADFRQNYYLHGSDSVVWQNVLVVESHDEVAKSFRIGRRKRS